VSVGMCGIVYFRVVVGCNGGRVDIVLSLAK
jgi:hypothetical protein